MKFYFFTKGDRNVPSSRCRAYHVAEALETLGYETTVTPAAEYSFGAFFRYLRMLRAAAPEDVVFLQRTIYNKYFFMAVLVARVCGRHFIFDLDDAVFEHSPVKTAILARLADFVTSGSEFVLAWTRRHNKHAVILPDGLPLSIYTMCEHEPDGIPVIGWIGSGPAHLENLRMIPPVLRSLSEKEIAFRFKLIGAVGDRRVYDLFADIPGVEIIDALNWSDPREAVREIQGFTIGIMPLTDAPWNQARYFKALEYMACGVPVVASPADTVKRIFAAAECGALAGSEAEWIGEITRLFNSADLRHQESEKGRRMIEQGYSTESVARQLLEYI